MHFDPFSYKLRIEALLMKEEFTHNMDWIRPSLNAIILTAQGKILEAPPKYINMSVNW